MRKREVYRMPSVGSISAVLKKSCYREDPSPFPVIDPRNSYYLLNLDGKCQEVQTALEGLFETEEIEVTHILKQIDIILLPWPFFLFVLYREKLDLNQSHLIRS